eukprot:2990285-Lingulodinium_polyedra.AAC.1
MWPISDIPKDLFFYDFEFAVKTFVELKNTILHEDEVQRLGHAQDIFDVRVEKQEGLPAAK